MSFDHYPADDMRCRSKKATRNGNQPSMLHAYSTFVIAASAAAFSGSQTAEQRQALLQAAMQLVGSSRAATVATAEAATDIMPRGCCDATGPGYAAPDQMPRISCDATAGPGLDACKSGLHACKSGLGSSSLDCSRSLPPASHSLSVGPSQPMPSAPVSVPYTYAIPIHRGR